MQHAEFEMVAKTFQGLEDTLAEELRSLGASNVMPGKRMVSFEGDLRMLYKANLCCRTALRVLKPFYKFKANTPDQLYEMCKKYDWGSLLTTDSSFCIDTVAYSDDFTHSQFVTFRVKDAIVDWFTDRLGPGKRPRVSLEGADMMINVHINNDDVTISLDSSGESLHKRGYRVAQTEAPINEVLAAGIILKTGWRGETPFVDPMCGSGTFLIEAALIAANIYPGVYRKHFSFETWPDFDRELFEEIYNDDSGEREVNVPIVGADILRQAIDITTRNAKSAGVYKYLTLECKSIEDWEQAPTPAGVLVTNPPYGRRISSKGMTLEELYKELGHKLKTVFPGYHAWVIGYTDEAFHQIGLAPSQKLPLFNGSLPCELREYILFEGKRQDYVMQNGSLSRNKDKDGDDDRDRKPRRFKDDDDRKPRRFNEDDRDRKPRRFKDDDDRDRKPRRFKDDDDRDRKPRRFKDDDDRDRKPRRFKDDDDRDRKPRRFKDDDRDRKPRRFKDDDRDRKPRRFKDDDRDRKPRRFNDSDDRAPRRELTEEELIMKRRNMAFLNGIRGSEPTLPATEGRFMRTRTWRKKKDDGTAPAE